jgi:hypothetical protein
MKRGCYEMTIFALQYCASTKINEKIGVSIKNDGAEVSYI